MTVFFTIELFYNTDLNENNIFQASIDAALRGKDFFIAPLRKDIVVYRFIQVEESVEHVSPSTSAQKQETGPIRKIFGENVPSGRSSNAKSASHGHKRKPLDDVNIKSTNQVNGKRSRVV